MAEEDHAIPKTFHYHDSEGAGFLKSMPGDLEFYQASALFAQLCDASRLRILWLICHSEICVNDLAAAVSMSAPAVSHHLRTLRQAGLIMGRREGKEVLYSLKDTKEAGLLHQMIDDMFEMNCKGRC